MAKSENNEVMYGARGRVGNLVVFRNYYGRTIIAKRQTKKDNPAYTAAQVIVKERFKEGVVYAKGAVLDPVLNAFYKPKAKGGVTVYNLALADFFKAPEITALHADTYSGNAGDYLTIRAVDNFKVVQVWVSIVAADGTVIESGLAQQAPNQLDWVYTATVANAAAAGSVVTVQATDTPGNRTEMEVVVE